MPPIPQGKDIPPHATKRGLTMRIHAQSALFGSSRRPFPPGYIL